MTINGRALTAISIGSVFIWSGIKGWSMLGTLTDIISGKKPEQVVGNPLTDPNYVPPVLGDSGNLNPNVNSGAYAGGIGGVAVQYVGHAYSFGGAPGRDGRNPWDCSSCVDWIIGVRLGGAIPGNKPGQYTGESHGPPTGAWLMWPGLTSISRDQVASGDIIIWADHMGIAISNAQMVSALNAREGTRVTNIEGTGVGPILKYGRYHG